ncbi:hypothetical protein BDN72DRAFT_394390 [Pluteus cervinus]|uniref:Uncharacterized protein n=1 Tax=Pluteus cervinus TaxID=181527 RepID=A0ACD3B296_9AGAR|nr:hypothetical protein BDN72DRAFT_394390 [Pluteus cervinus]
MVLYFGRNKYVRSDPTGSILSEALQLCFFAAKGLWSLNPARAYRQFTVANFWEKAGKPETRLDDIQRSVGRRSPKRVQSSQYIRLVPTILVDVQPAEQQFTLLSCNDVDIRSPERGLVKLEA